MAKCAAACRLDQGRTNRSTSHGNVGSLPAQRVTAECSEAVEDGACKGMASPHQMVTAAVDPLPSSPDSCPDGSSSAMDAQPSMGITGTGATASCSLGHCQPTSTFQPPPSLPSQPMLNDCGGSCLDMLHQSGKSQLAPGHAILPQKQEVDMRGPDMHEPASRLQRNEGATSATARASSISEPRLLSNERDGFELLLNQQHHAALQEVPAPRHAQSAVPSQHLGPAWCPTEGHVAAERLPSQGHMPGWPPADQLLAAARATDPPHAHQNDLGNKTAHAKLCTMKTPGEDRPRPQVREKYSGIPRASSSNGLRQTCQLSDPQPHVMPQPLSSCNTIRTLLRTSDRLGGQQEPLLNGGALLQPSLEMSMLAIKSTASARDGATADTAATILQRLTRHDQQLAKDRGEYLTGHPTCSHKLCQSTQQDSHNGNVQLGHFEWIG